MKLSQIELQHLCLRAGFGAEPDFIRKNTGASREDLVKQLFKAARSYQEIKAFKWKPKEDKKQLSPAKRRALNKLQRQQVQTLNELWLEKMARDPAQLTEKMTFFWHDHFAAQLNHPFGMQDFNNLLRRHALGNFKTLLMAVAKHPVMISYLNNQQNKKSHPNENFARELMELFTLGVGHYTEQDIKEAARAFTGWSFKEDEFILRKRQHDFGPKTFRGQSGDLDGEDIVHMLLADKQTARYICEKWYRFFVNPRIHPARVEAMATTFYDSDYDIGKTLAEMFLSDWFYAPENRGCRIKSPVEYLATMMRSLKLTIENQDTLTKVQHILGQVLFQPPNVSGWTEDRGWIDSSSLSTRMVLPSVIILAAEAELYESVDFMDKAQQKQMRKLRKMNAKVDWRELEKMCKHIPQAQMPEFLAGYLFQVQPGAAKLQALDQLTDRSSAGNYLKTLVAQLMALPEYQLA